MMQQKVKLTKQAKEMFIKVLRNNLINSDFARYFDKQFDIVIMPKMQPIKIEVIDRPEQVKKTGDTPPPVYYAPNKYLKRLILGVLACQSVDKTTANRISRICKDLAALDKSKFITIIDLTTKKL